VISEGTPFYTLDRGTVGTSIALIGPLDGRSRLLAASSAPDGVDVEAVLEDLAWRVARTDPAAIAPPEGWRDWPRLEVRTMRPRRAVLVAASERSGMALDDAFTRSGWEIGSRHFGSRPDVLALGEACLELEVDAVVVGIPDGAEDEERIQMRSTWPLVVSIASMRDDLAIVACGSFSERPEAIADERLFALPAPEPAASGIDLMLWDAARQVAEHLAWQGAPVPDGHQAFRTSVASLAVLLGCNVEGIEVGATSSSRTLASVEREVRHRVSAGGLRLPAGEGERALDAVLRWCSAQGDAAALGDRLRDLTARPWQPLDPDAARLRLASLRAALWRLREPSDGSAAGRVEGDPSDVVVLAGGFMHGLPPLAMALAITDVIREPGATTILGDHARVLAPLGALESERDRRRILADLMDDCLLPIGSTLLTGDAAPGSQTFATVGVSSTLGSERLSLVSEQLQTVDLPPGIVARLDIDPGEGTVLGVSGRRIALEVSGGLGGLLIDTRPIALSLPEGGELRRAVLEAWEGPAWARSTTAEAAA
jgi:hypothetical protein